MTAGGNCKYVEFFTSRLRCGSFVGEESDVRSDVSSEEKMREQKRGGENYISRYPTEITDFGFYGHASFEDILRFDFCNGILR